MGSFGGGVDVVVDRGGELDARLRFAAIGSSTCMRPHKLSISALSKADPTAPIDREMPVWVRVWLKGPRR
jgi:hypothetical protein